MKTRLKKLFFAPKSRYKYKLKKAQRHKGTEAQRLKIRIKKTPMLFKLMYIIISICILSIPCTVMAQRKAGNSEINQELTQSNNKIIVHVGKAPITTNDLKEYITYRPASLKPSGIHKELEKRLEEMIVSEALYQEALLQNLHQDPKIKRIIHQILTQKLMEEKVERPVMTRNIDEEELKIYYNKHEYEFNRPEQVRLADIFIAVDSGATPDQRAETKKKAESILSEALKKGEGRSDFGELIGKHSDKHPKYSKGDTRYFDVEGKPVGLDGKLAEQAFKLKRIGEICDHVIETKEGYHLIMLVEKRPAVHKPLEDVKGLIERRIRREELEVSREAYIKQVKEGVDIQKNKQAIKEGFEEIRKTYTSKKAGRPGSGYRGRGMPPPFPGEFK